MTARPDTIITVRPLYIERAQIPAVTTPTKTQDAKDAERLDWLAFEALPSEIQQAVVTLRAVSEWLESSVNYGSSSPDEPPQLYAEFDYRLSQAAAEISGVASRIEAARNPGAGRVVPIEPTREMEDAAIRELGWCAEDVAAAELDDDERIDLRTTYRAMLSAAPDEPQPATALAVIEHYKKGQK